MSKMRPSSAYIAIYFMFIPKDTIHLIYLWFKFDENTSYICKNKINVPCLPNLYSYTEERCIMIHIHTTLFQKLDLKYRGKWFSHTFV